MYNGWGFLTIFADDFCKQLHGNLRIGPERGRGSIKRRVDPIFNIKIWNVFDRVAEEQARTNNAIEGFNSAIQKTLSCQHPTIWKLISSLKKEAVMEKKKLMEEGQGYCANPATAAAVAAHFSN